MRTLPSVSRNSPMEGSRVNMDTPAPTVSTIWVLEPYMAYPAATRLEPGCSASAALQGKQGVG